MRLSSAFPNDPLDRQDVAKLVMELMQGHEDTLGAYSPTPRAMVKIAASHWRDHSPGGALFAILRRCLQHKHAHSLRRFDWQSDHKRAEFIEMMSRCLQDLRDKGVVRRVKVCLSSDLPPDVARACRDDAVAMGTVLAAAPDEEGVTHVIYPDTSLDVSPDADERPPVVLGVVGKEALVRFPRHPDSYDQWLSVSAATSNAAPNPNLTSPPPDEDETSDPLGLETRAAARVTARWLADSRRFNEWCREEDYAREDPVERAERAAREAAAARETAAREANAMLARTPGHFSGVGTPSTGPSSGAKRRAGEDADGETAPCRFAERVSSILVKRQMVAPHRAVATAAANDAGLAPLQTAARLGSIPNVPSIAAALPPGSRVAQENITRGQYPEAERRAASVAAVVADAAAKTLPDASTDKGTPTDGTPENDGTPKNDGTLVPGHAAWFRASPKPPRAVERRGVPEFFAGDARATPEAYVAVRDAMILGDRAFVARGEAMTLADALGCASEALSASALTPETAQRVYDFLRRWGLIGWNGETKRGGGDDDDPAIATRQTRPTRPPSGTTEAAADALYRFAPAPANAAAAYAAAARDAASRAATNPYGVRDLNFVRLGRPPKNPAAIAAAAARDAAADAERDDAGVKNDAPPERACRACASALAGAGRPYYHCANPPAAATPTATEREHGFNLCGACFFSGALPDGTSSASFARAEVVDAAGAGADAAEDEEEDEDDGDDDWTDQETLMLLEGLERHGEKWTEVADHVGTKTAEECVRRFVRLPIEDAFVEDVDPGTRARGAGRGAGNVGKTFDDEIVGEWGALGVPDPNAAAKDDIVTPFAGAPNPVMANVAFLATCVGPRVAAAAARAALAYLSAAAEGDDDEEEGDVDVDIDGKEREANAAKPDAEGMDVDGGEGTGLKGEEEEEDLGPAPAVSAEMCRGAAAAGFAAAAVKAKLLADQDEHEIQKLVVGVVEMQMRKIELKLRHVEELDAGLNREREGVERIIAQLAAERVKHAAERKDIEERLAAATERRQDDTQGATADGVVEIAPAANTPAAAATGAATAPTAATSSGA